jgi:hypothetical protein
MGQEPATEPAKGEPEAPEPSKPEANNEPPASGDSPKTFDETYVKELRAENAKWRIEAQQRQERLEEYEEQNKSELERAQSKAAKAEGKAQEAEAALLRFQIAAEKQVPGEALDLLSGKTREELEASADKILNLVKNRNENSEKPDFDGGAREPAENTDPVQAHNDVVSTLVFGSNRT